MFKKFRMIFHPGDALIVNRWLEMAFVILWFIYGSWGIASLISGIPTVIDATQPWYAVVWSGLLGLFAYIAGFFGLSVFFNIRPSSLIKRHGERAAVVVLIAFIAIYPLLLWVSALEGDSRRLASAILSLSYLVFPVLRVYLLTQKIKFYAVQ